MGKYRKKVQVVILLAVVILGGFAIYQSFLDDSRGVQIKPGAAPPEFKLASLSGEAISLSDYVGKAVVVNFWGTFCEPCIREMPSFENQYQKWADKDVAILAINLSEDDLTVTKFVNNLNLSYPILRDVDRKTEKKYGLRSYPTTFFIKPDGTLLETFQGEMTEEQINDNIERLLQ